MKISELLKKNTPTLSFEVFPPKTSDTLESVKTAAESIALLRPDFMSITYGAGGTNAGMSLEIAKDLADHGVVPLAHLTCVQATEAGIAQRLDAFRSAGVENIMALRGDMPKEITLPPEQWAFMHADELIRFIKSHGDFCIGGACYPETHPESLSRKEDIASLKRKVDNGCDFLTTQMFFDNNILFNFLYQLREAGVNVPVVAGIMPITNANQMRRTLEISGAGTYIPQRFKSLLDRFGSDPKAMMQAGIAYATDQIIDLYANGINHVHVYTMNKPEVARKITENLSDILGR